MTRAERLLALLQVLRRHRRPVSGRVLAGELGVSLRTVYRDIASLQAQGADIDGEPGVGYVLRAGFMLPPLMFSQTELEALMLGFRWVGKFADAQLTTAASDALAKICAVLPDELRREMECTTLLVGPRTIVDRETVDMGVVRMAIRTESKVRIRYADEGRKTGGERIVWPFALGYFNDVRILAAWCEGRNDFRHFRTDRIVALERLDVRYPRRRAALLKAWRAAGADVRVTVR
ncbi:TPA: YafY family transcriptional regulator [Burkholderia cepacia ATCC 25416]|uniref:helix-turn-helix transcriptional regulator n=1 Tax=Burkholderia cepacia TaxID=292 RepID=UPI001CF295E9|nr:YafY family protein [Burkholderia cepacia]HDR9766780.1 YafY family transcriptional regulator [Burkholderia cepacia ATCC 25416]MCA8077803.1 YafY family transcriptional regulator [Burkholderia cepacia]HDR9774590.1 YafY family transcriptional regulator [Burkholderia cepacia ATCC 25416]HDR9785189.1 YafY family transcriptional regulator [Burkholderia cepacia ATCC 25416]HDR9793374.1 YafY family transcriptional regulator [Burkholderia cepacia ATCC 25416]